jgi:hypothetical protein
MYSYIARIERMVVLGIALVSWGAVARAEGIMFSFTGTVTAVHDSTGVLQSHFGVGQLLGGTYSFESTTPDTDPSQSTGFYAGALTSMDVAFGDVCAVHLISASDSAIVVGDDTGLTNAIDQYIAFGDVTGTSVGGMSPARLGINLLAADPSTFSSDALPLVPPPLSAFVLAEDYSTLFFGAGPELEPRVDFDLTVWMLTLPGDVNFDGAVDGLDVDPFVDVMINGLFNGAADMNEDGVVNGLDVDPFVAVVVGTGAQAAPEPSTALLAAASLIGITFWLRL